MSREKVFLSRPVRLFLVTVVAIVGATQVAAAPFVVDTTTPGLGTLGTWLTSLHFWGFWGR